MSLVQSRLRFVLAATLSACLTVLATSAAPPRTDARDGQIGIRAFLTGLACTESGGRFDALNKGSGSFGKYQIMPRNWSAWAGIYMGNRWAQPTPRNQEFVARQRISDLYVKRGDWRRVAHWWLTGDGESKERLWSAKSTGYVNTVMAIAERAATRRYTDTVPPRCYPLEISDPAIRSQRLPRGHVLGGRVNVRLAPGYENRAVDVVRRGDRVALLAKGFDARGKRWLKVGLIDGQVGWVASWFVGP